MSALACECDRQGGKRARKGERGYESEMYRPAPRRLALVGGMLVVAILALVAARGAPSVPLEGPPPSAAPGGAGCLEDRRGRQSPTLLGSIA